MTIYKKTSFLLLLVLLIFSPCCQSRVAQWEKDVLEVWGKEPDCSLSNGMCDVCGVGATIVEIDKDGKMTALSAMAGPDTSAEPYNHNEATFEIASYTKHFTAIAMVHLETKILGFAETSLGKWLPCDWEAAWNLSVQETTLQELRLHASGSPPQAPNHELAGSNGNPFAGHMETMLCDSLLKLTGLPAKGRFACSNCAHAMLGHALAIASTKPGQRQKTHEDVAKEEVLDPLGVNHASVTLDDEGWKKAAKGCGRGCKRGEHARRRGECGVLQGDGAL